MKFESKFSLGEIVAYRTYSREDKGNPYHSTEELLEVKGVYFGKDGQVEYICRYPGTGVTTGFSESELISDPDVDRERISSLAKVFAEHHAEDRDCLGEAARELLALLGDTPYPKDFDC